MEGAIDKCRLHKGKYDARHDRRYITDEGAMVIVDSAGAKGMNSSR